MAVRVFLVEDEPSVRRGLELLLNREPDIQICGSAPGQQEALRRILALKPDLAIVDLSLKQGSGLDLLRDLHAFKAAPKTLVFSMHGQAGDVRSALRAGANGYVTKEDGTEYLVDAIHAVLLGKCFLTEAVAQKLGNKNLNSGAVDSRHK